ncbi:MAG: hypothetical protein RLT05_10455, partial [Bauldia litoralis]
SSDPPVCSKVDKSPMHPPPDSEGQFRDLLDGATLSAALAGRILRACSVRNLPARTYLQHVDDDPGGMWGLAEGALSVEFAPGTRDPNMGYILLPPVWVAEGGVVSGIRRMVGLSTTRCICLCTSSSASRGTSR